MFVFPWTNLHELNLDWILQQVKRLVDSNDEFNEKADYAVETADEAKEIAEQAAQATIPDGAVTTIKLADGAVTGNKIAQATIQTGNLSAGCVTTPKILDNAVTAAKLNYTIVSVSIPYTIAASSTFHSNLHTAIMAALATGYTPLGIIGFSTGNGNAFPINVQEQNNDYSLYLKNNIASEITGTFSAQVLALYS